LSSFFALTFPKTGNKSATTLSSYDELRTPATQNTGFEAFGLPPDDVIPMKSVEGPVGPHLFRMSQDTSQDVDIYLTLSPATSPQEFRAPIQRHRGLETYNEPPRTSVPLRTWTPQQVAEWMYSTGFDRPICDTFFINDISGVTLIDLQYEDLKELGIASFGQRHKLWTEIKALREAKLPAPGEDPYFTQLDLPRASTIEEPPRKCSPEDFAEETLSPTTGRRRGRRPLDDVVSPAESASIVAIEQLLPKPHKCSKGENCRHFQKYQRKLARIRAEFPLEMGQLEEKTSPMESGLVPSLVASIEPSIIASSDVLGAQKPKFRLEEHSLRDVPARDPQESVKQFLNFQHINQKDETPMTPPYEMFPPLSPPKPQAPHANLRSLPKLMIPSDNNATTQTFSPNRTAVPSRHMTSTPLTVMNVSQYPTVHDIYRIASPASEMDVPVTAIPVGPIERDFSSSVPPDMRYGGGEILARSNSRLGFRSTTQSFSQPFSPIKRSTSHAGNRGQRPSVVVHSVPEEIENAPTEIDDLTPTAENGPHQQQGWMKKRKTKMLRHEWNEHHFRLDGTQLAMHKDEKAIDAIEYIDVDDYAVAISANNSKFNSAMKRLHLNAGKGKGLDPGDFAFQLTPAADKKGVLHAATGKTHHFAVKTQTERIDWMREIMLAKAKRQKDAVCASFD
jgi:hypothetical protein